MLTNTAGTPAQQTAALASIDSRADECSTMLTTMKSTDCLKYDGVAKLPPIVQEALNRPRAGMSLDDRVAEDYFATAVVASYRLNSQIMPGEIAELRAHEHAQTKALVDYHAIHVFDDATQDNVGERITELRTHLQAGIRRIEDKEPNPKAGSNAARKLDMLRQEDTRLGALKDMVDTKVCFSVIQFRLESIVENVAQAARIQRTFIHGRTTSTEDNLLSSTSRFSQLKQAMHERLQERLDVKEGGAVANDAEHDDDAEGERDGHDMSA